MLERPIDTLSCYTNSGTFVSIYIQTVSAFLLELFPFYSGLIRVDTTNVENVKFLTFYENSELWTWLQLQLEVNVSLASHCCLFWIKILTNHISWQIPVNSTIKPLLMKEVVSPRTKYNLVYSTPSFRHCCVMEREVAL